MKINKQTAQKIVNRTMNIIQNSVNVMDENGIIIASGDSSRLNQKHIGAILAIRENRVIEVDQALAEKWNFEVKPGINMPITYLGRILGAVGISGEPDSVRSYTELVKMTAELIIEQYILLEQERWLHRYKEEFILQLLDETHQITALKQQAHFFNIDLQHPYTVVIIQLPMTSAELLQELTTYLQQPHFNHHLAILALDKIVLLVPQKQIKNKELTKLLPEAAILQNYHIAVGGCFASESKIHYSYQTALSTLEYGLQYHPKKTIYFFDQYQLPVLLQNLTRSWQAEELLKPIQKLIQQDPNHTLRKTLQQYFLSNCDLSLTSQKLFIHINTLRYRLHKIEQITCLSFNRIADLFILYLGTLLLP